MWDNSKATWQLLASSRTRYGKLDNGLNGELLLLKLLGTNLVWCLDSPRRSHYPGSGNSQKSSEDRWEEQSRVQCGEDHDWLVQSVKAETKDIFSETKMQSVQVMSVMLPLLMAQSPCPNDETSCILRHLLSQGLIRDDMSKYTRLLNKFW